MFLVWPAVVAMLVIAIILSVFRLGRSILLLPLAAAIVVAAITTRGQANYCFWLAGCIGSFLGIILGCCIDARLQAREPADVRLFDPAKWPDEWEHNQ